MTDAELIARLRARAAEERDIQRNNEAVAAALMGQRLLFDQGIRSKANSFAVRLGLEHENCAKNDAKLARDWDAAADRIEALIAERNDWESHAIYNAEFVDIAVSYRNERDAARAELTKAVEAVDKAAALIEERHVVHMTAKGRNPKDYISEWSLIAKEVRATLAELKGETHDPL